jgi:carbon-monoxide dehydrogenase medium subunit
MGTRVLPEFNYLRPASIEEALSLGKRFGGRAKFLAGGTDLLVDMKLLRTEPEYLIDITAIPELRGITFDGKELRIGPTTRIRELTAHSVLTADYAALSEATSEMATTQIRNIATIGGNLCTASPGAENAPPLLVFGASVEIRNASGTKKVPLEDFFVGPKKSTLDPGSLLTCISIPVPTGNAGSAYLRISRTHSDLRQINAAAALVTENGICKDVRIALGAVAPTPVRARKAEDMLRNRRLDQRRIEEAMLRVVADIEPRTSIRSTSDYRRRVAPVLVRRVLQRAHDRIRTP